MTFKGIEFGAYTQAGGVVLVIETLRDGKTYSVALQGDEAYEMTDLLDALETPEEVDRACGEYAHIMRVDA